MFINKVSVILKTQCLNVKVQKLVVFGHASNLVITLTVRPMEIPGVGFFVDYDEWDCVTSEESISIPVLRGECLGKARMNPKADFQIW